MSDKYKYDKQEILDEYCVDYRTSSSCAKSNIKRELPITEKGSFYNIPETKSNTTEQFIEENFRPQTNHKSTNAIFCRCILGTVLLLIIFVSVGFISTILFEQINCIANIDVFALEINSCR